MEHEASLELKMVNREIIGLAAFIIFLSAFGFVKYGNGREGGRAEALRSACYEYNAWEACAELATLTHAGRRIVHLGADGSSSVGPASGDLGDCSEVAFLVDKIDQIKRARKMQEVGVVAAPAERDRVDRIGRGLVEAYNKCVEQKESWP